MNKDEKLVALQQGNKMRLILHCGIDRILESWNPFIENIAFGESEQVS